jgi:2-amino-4-hydroxy-6-hydroxymethyldihydropteridine diphosphokinase
MSQLHTVYLGLGSNLGEREAHLAEAIRRLGEFVTVEAQSSVYATEPWGYLDQPAFLNQVVAGRSQMEPEALLQAVKGIERSMGRVPTFHYGPRVIDIDILLFGSLQATSPALTLPHPHMSERAFVLIPLAELDPDMIIPGTSETVAALASKAPGAEGVIRQGTKTEID